MTLEILGCWLAFSSWVVAVTLPPVAWGQSCPPNISERSGKDKQEKTPLSSEPLVLKDLITELQNRNPALRSALGSAQAMKARTHSARALPDPVISFQTMGGLIPPELQRGDPSSGRTYGVEQEIPFPGKLGLKGEVADSEAAAEEWNAEQTRRELIAELKTAYLDLFFVHESLEILQRAREFLESVARVSEARYRVGEGNMQAVVKARLETSRLLDRETLLQQRRHATETRMGFHLNLPAGHPLGEPVPMEKAALPYSLDRLVEMAMENAPGLRTQEKRVDRSRYAAELARREYYPDFSIGISYVDRNSQKEMYSIMAKAKVPLYFWQKQHPELEGARQDLDSAMKLRESIASNIAYRVREAHIAATTSDRLLELYAGNVLPQARVSLESALAAYQSGSTDFSTVMESSGTLLEYELRYREALADYHKALGKLEPLIGLALIQ